jgi:two-component sensor histidine kinase
MRLNHVPIILVASTLAMIGLVIFQYKWIEHSRKLSEEIFNQRASMALCSTLEEYSDGALCSPSNCSMVCGMDTTRASALDPRLDLMHNEGFHADLKKTLDFYNINLNYQMTQTPVEPAEQTGKEAPQCVVNIPPHIDQQESFVALAFPEKEKFMMGKLKYMIGASLVILLFTAIVLWLANWWLLKQKRLLRTNMEIYNNMAHEFRTPLTNINLAATLLSKNITQQGDRKFLDIINKENSRLIQQVERVLHLARLDNGDYALKNERLHLKTLLVNVCDEMEIQIQEKNAMVSFQDIPDKFEIYGDRQHLINVFRNLIDNALKYSEQQPEITISAREEKDGILISVQDNGIGIPVSQSRVIFEKFQRIQDGQLCEQKGFGLGLAYVKRIVELHKGFIQLDSNTDQGSRFNVFLPKFC